MNAKSLLWGLTLFVLSLQQMYAQFTVGTLQPLEGFGTIFEHKTLLVEKAEGKQYETRNSNCKTI